MKPVQVVQVVGTVPVPEPKICCCFKRRSCGPQGSCLRSCGVVTLVLCIAHFVATVQMASYWSSWSDDVVDNEEFREDFIDLCEDTSLRSFAMLARLLFVGLDSVTGRDTVVCR